MDVDVDELFNGDNVLGDASFEVSLGPQDVGLLPVQTAVPVGLVQHIDELRNCGSAQRVAWSRQGCIASLSADSLHVKILCLRFGRADSSWSLSEQWDLFTGDYPHSLTHLQWSPTGVDLALVDTAGRLGIFSISPVAVNKMTEVRPASLDSTDELNQAVALFWLNQDRPRDMVLQSSKEDTRWKHIMTKRKPQGPHFPRATAVVTKSGSMRLVFQRPDQKWSDAAVALQEPSSPDEYLIHAAIAPTLEGKLLIATCTYKQKLSLYLVHLQWPDLKHHPTADISPTFEVESIESDIPSGLSSEQDVAAGVFTGELYNPSMWSMTHLEIIPTSDIEKTPHSPPTICAVYTTTNNAVDITSPSYISTSTIRRWTILTIPQTLHPRFDDVTVKPPTATITPKPKHTVSKLTPDIPFNQVITSLQLVDSHQSLAITTQNGETTFFKPDTLTQAFLEGEPNEALSLSQSGFVYPPTPQPCQLAFSPNASSFVSLDPVTADLQLHTMHFPAATLQPTSETQQLDPQLDVALAALVLTFARASYSSTNTDDLLLCALTNFTPPIITILLNHMYRTIFRNVEVVGPDAPGSEINQLHTKQMCLKVLSFHAALGFTHGPQSGEEIKERNCLAKVAWLTIHLRYLAILFYFFMSVVRNPAAATQQQQGHGNQPPTFHPDFVELLCDNVRWFLELARWCLDGAMERRERELYREFFANVTENADGNLGEKEERENEKEDLTVLLLMCAWPRYFARLALKLIGMTVNIPAAQAAGGNVFARVADVVRRNSIGMTLQGVDRMFDIRPLVSGSDGVGIGVAGRAEAEYAAMSLGVVPDGWRESVRTFVGSVMAEGEMVERLGLFVGRGNLKWEAVGVEGEDVRGRGEDVYRKVFVGGNGGEGKVRICVRCGGMSEDLVLDGEWSRPLFTHMTRQMSRCICESGWIGV